MTVREHRRTTRTMTDAIVERQRRGVVVETSQLIGLMVAQQSYLEAIDDQVYAEENGRG